MMDAVPDLVRFADPPDSEDKHLPFFAREAQIGDRMLVMNIRRLPAWALSGAQHKARHGVAPDYVPTPLESADAITSRTDADDLLRWMTDHGRFEVTRWLRCEQLEQDVLSLLDDLGALTPSVAEAVRAVGRVNVGDYDRAVDHWFTANQRRRLYDMNPTWAAIERSAHGDRAGVFRPQTASGA